MIVVRTNRQLLEHLSTFEVDGGTVDSLLFEGGRLSYPGRKEIEYELGYAEPYTLELEARVIEGLPKNVCSAIRMLAESALGFNSERPDPTLELLWDSHRSWPDTRFKPSPDRLVAALVGLDLMLESPNLVDVLKDAGYVLVRGLHALGFPPTRRGLEELFDGAPPACVGLGLVEL